MKIRHRNRQEKRPGTVPDGWILATLVLGPVLGTALILFSLWRLTRTPGSVFHYRKLLCLDYSEVQLQQIAVFCPYEVPDLRGKGNYRL